LEINIKVFSYENILMLTDINRLTSGFRAATAVL
jgi:hypothetical protein